MTHVSGSPCLDVTGDECPAVAGAASRAAGSCCDTMLCRVPQCSPGPEASALQPTTQSELRKLCKVTHSSTAWLQFCYWHMIGTPLSESRTGASMRDSSLSAIKVYVPSYSCIDGVSYVL
jgi:hypothetical protein